MNDLKQMDCCSLLAVTKAVFIFNVNINVAIMCPSRLYGMVMCLRGFFFFFFFH